MPDNLALHHIHHEFSNVRCMVGNPFVILADEREACRPRDGIGVFQHIRDKLSEKLLREVVDIGIVPTNFTRQFDIAVDKGIQAFFDHLARALSHSRYIDIGFKLRLFVQLDRPFGDVFGHIAHPFEFRGDLHGRRDISKITGPWVIERQQAQAILVNFQVQPVDSQVVFDDSNRQVRVALGQCLQDVLQLRFD